jgi:CubicO group peptidase (beta-lactamase class C family)
MAMDKLGQFLQRSRDHRVFSGAAYEIGTPDRIIARGCIGTLEWSGEPVSESSLWDIASLTKVIVSLGTMRLFEAGELCLDDTVARFLPDYVGTDKADITLFDLMTHTSGIPGQQPLYKQITTREDMLVAIRNLPLRFARGTDVEYTSQGYVVLGTVLEKICGRGLDALVSDEVLRPLAMNATLYNPGPELHSRIAATEDCPWRGRIVKGQVHDENAVVLGGVCGHAGLFSNVHDLTNVCKAMLSEGYVDNTKFLSPSTVALMTRNHTPHLKLARGLGWQSKDRHNSPAGDLYSRNAFGHTGFTGTSMWIDPDRRLYAVLLTNRVHPSRQSEEIRRVRSIFHNLAVLKAEELN